MSSIQNALASRGWAVIFVLASCATLAGCPTTNQPITPIAKAACGCADTPSAPPPGYDRETSCFDGCNWCVCTADGLARCTAVGCVDAGALDAGTPRAPLPREACGCEGGPPPPPGMDPATTCYDGCNWCTCTAEGLANCTARACWPDAGPPELRDTAPIGTPFHFCLGVIERLTETCAGQVDRTCEHEEARVRCGTERADVLEDAYQCLLDASIGTGSCRTFGDPSGASSCLDALVERTPLSPAGEALAADLEALCPGASRARLLGGGAMPIIALSDETIGRLQRCLDGATECSGFGACIEAEYPEIVACHR